MQQALSFRKSTPNPSPNKVRRFLGRWRFNPGIRHDTSQQAVSERQKPRVLLWGECSACIGSRADWLTSMGVDVIIVDSTSAAISALPDSRAELVIIDLDTCEPAHNFLRRLECERRVGFSTPVITVSEAELAARQKGQAVTLEPCLHVRRPFEQRNLAELALAFCGIRGEVAGDSRDINVARACEQSAIHV